MKRTLILLCLFVSVVANATTYYVAPNGSDNNPGTIGSPFATWGKLSSVLVAGDVAYIRGGTYRSPYTSSAYSHVGFYSLTGTSTNNIKIFAYPDETPVLNLDNITPNGSYCFGLFMQNCNYVYLKGLRITGLPQNSNGNSITGMYIANSPNCIFEECEVDHIGGYGIVLGDGSNNILFKNCDVHHCTDPYTSYENANGFNITGGSTATNITYDGCRAWKCSDDGWDFFLSDGSYTLKNCWSFFNGYNDSFSYLGDGQGFKLGPTQSDKSGTRLRTITNCLAAKNSHNGFDQNSTTYTGIYYFYNNDAYDNGAVGFSFDYLNGISNVFKNNLAFANDVTDGRFGSGTIQSNNTWNGGVVATTGDFASVDLFLLESPRQSDGSLPDISFLHLNSGSDLIDAGVDVGLPYNGYDPDLGAFEFQNGQVITVPVYISSSVENATPATIEMDYNSTLANIVPDISAFVVRVNSAVRTITSVSINGSSVWLNLGIRIYFGDVIEVSYTKPSSNPLQTSSGGQAVSITSQSVANHVSPLTPYYISSSVENATPSVVQVNYNMNLANIIPAVSAFTVRVNSSARTVNTVTISGAQVQLTLASPVVYGDIVTVAYTKPSSNPLQTPNGGQAETISAQSVTNYVTTIPPVNPLYVSSSVENATPSVLQMSYNMTMSNVIPATSAFSVLVNSVTRTINSVAISGTNVLVTLSAPVKYGDIVTISYTKPSVNPLQSPSGGQAVSITAQPVTNNVVYVAPGIPVYVSSSVENATPSVLEMTYNMTLASVLPSTSAFSVLVNSSARSVNSIAISGTKVLLTMSSAVVYGDIITISYTKPASNPLQTSAGGQAASLTAQPVTNNVNSIDPVYSRSVVENSTPGILEVSYSMNLANVVPATSAFSVNVNSVARSVSAVMINGVKVLLSLAGEIVYGDIVTVSYTKPTVNFLQTSSGLQAASFSNKAVTNNVSPLTPVYLSSTINNVTPSLLEMTYNSTLANIIPASSAFAVTVNSVIRPVSSVNISGDRVILTLAGEVIYGDIVTVTYTKPLTNQLQTTSGNLASSINTKVVMNKVNPITPVYISATIENSTPSLLEMTYSTNLAHLIPAASSFSVFVNSNLKNVKTVAITGSKVILTLENAVVFGDEVTVSYTEPPNNMIQTDAGGKAESVTTQPVTNNCLKKTDGLTGIKILFYPNPAHEIINILIQEATSSAKIIKIIDSNGKLVLTENIAKGIREVHIPVKFNSGIYFVILEEGSVRLYTQRLIII